MTGANGNGAGGHGGSVDLAVAIVDSLDDAGLELLAERLRPWLVDAVAERLAGRIQGDRWLSTREASEYLGLTVTALHKLTAARSVPFAQDVAGGKLWFKRSELDAWRRG
jgi:excisionase family DNA binding protein